MNMHFVINQTRTHGNLIEDGFLGVFPRRTRVPPSHHGTRVSRGTHARRSPTRRQRRRGFLYKNFVHSRAPPRVVDDGADDGTDDDDASDRSDHQSVETIGGARTRFGFLLFRGLCARAMGDATRKRDERERFTVEFVFVARSRRVVRRFVRPTTGVRIRSIGRSDGRSSIRSDVPAATARFCARLTLRARRPS
jgi:hypothetical protein